jgi:hypothetical protein
VRAVDNADDCVDTVIVGATTLIRWSMLSKRRQQRVVAIVVSNIPPHLKQIGGVVADSVFDLPFKIM